MNETLKNLVKAFIGESQARNRYTFYAKIAKKEGFEKISQVFLVTAENEKEHAKSLFDLIQALKKKLNVTLDEIEVEASAVIKLGNSIENLKSAIHGEHYETSEMYPHFADVAEKEGFIDIANRLRAIAVAEKHHEERFTHILIELENNTFFKKDKKVYWVCMECGYVYEGEEPPEECPSCKHPKSYFELKCEDY
ncbi:MAG: hypothetical protein PWP03_123 [Candidatus Woesearchaeota archaeon]|nr:hypothetical protein [Candidatus Woesearchaeota archaeon]